MSVMLLFTAIGHFAFPRGMMMMLPPFISFRLALVYITGIIEIMAAIGLQIPNLRNLTAVLLIIFFILIDSGKYLRSCKTYRLSERRKRWPGPSIPLVPHTVANTVYILDLDEHSINSACYSQSFSFNRKKVIRTGMAAALSTNPLHREKGLYTGACISNSWIIISLKAGLETEPPANKKPEFFTLLFNFQWTECQIPAQCRILTHTVDRNYRLMGYFLRLCIVFPKRSNSLNDDFLRLIIPPEKSL